MLILATLLLLGISLRAYQLDRALGGGDENQLLLEWAYSPINHIITTFSNGLGPGHVFHNITVRMMILLFGEENALAIRFPAFAAGIACLWVIYKIAGQIFSTERLAQLTLLAMVVCPIHIYYSQTARGYSFIMLFSAVSIYATLKLLKSDKHFRWGFLLILSGFLSVYTLPLTVIFILGLAIWIISVLTVPSLKKEFGQHLEPISKNFYRFALVFLLMGICSLFSYWPLIDDMMKSLDGLHEARKVYSSSWEILIYFIPNFFLKTFPGHLVYFTPFIIAGIFFDKTCPRAYRLLPIIIFITTYLVTIATGWAWYPRGYLFNLPLFLIFFVSGVMWVGERLKSMIKFSTPANWVGYSIMGVYAALSLAEIFINHYPSTKTYNPEEYRHKINSQTQKNDLLLVADSRSYLYARGVYKNKLQNVITDNQLDGIKLLVNNSLNIGDYKVSTTSGNLPIFSYWRGELNSVNVSKNRKLIYLDKINSTPLLSNDFEATTDWVVQSGAGEFNSTKEHKFSGEYSLITKASQKQNLVLRSFLGQIKLDQPQLVVLVWATKKFASNDKYFVPALGISPTINGKKQYAQVLLGKTNPGMNIQIKEETSGEETYYWQIHSAIGWLPPGEFPLDLFLYCEAGKSIMYDSLRLFLVNDIPST